ncbi:MAG: thiamine pyrophosphate-dependent enzyme [Pseudomonadales bacterium]
MNRAEIIHQNFTQRVRAEDFPQPSVVLTPQDVHLASWEVVDLFESQVMSRLLDLTSRRLSARKESFYTIGSAGHEGNAVFGKVFRHTDMAFLHYRSCALMIQRSKQVMGLAPLYETLLSFAASSEDPTSGGRHKVLGSKALLVPPQTSTIASHLPKAMGAAHAIGLASRLRLVDATMPHDSVVICNFGDASANHSTALGAVNAAAWAAYQGSPMPVIFICEDNGIGISTQTPMGWIKAKYSQHPGLKYITCDGLNMLDTQRAATEVADYARKTKKPVFLHCRTIRLAGHAGSDAETSYLTREQLETTEAQDPLLHSARIIWENSLMTASQICKFYNNLEARIERIAEVAIQRPKLSTATDVMASIIPKPALPAPLPIPTEEMRQALFGRDVRLFDKPQHMGRLINLALADIMLQYPTTVICGEDVGKKGGVYGVTQGLHQKFGTARMINTLLDEQTILGLAIGMAHNGLLPIPEIQFLAYVHNAEDQIRGEAATLSFFSDGQFTNPMVIRIAGLAYQKGFGGHFHNDNSFNVFRDIPGLIVACPSNGKDAVQMLRSCIKLAHEEKRVVVFLEPIALYMTRDLHETNDGLWTSLYEPPGTGQPIVPGQIGIFGAGKDIGILTYANGYHLSLQAAKKLFDEHGINCRIVDLRWLLPLNAAAVVEAIAPCDSVLIVDECRRTGSIGEELVTLLVEANITVPIQRVAAEDSFIPLGAAANLVLPSVESIIENALKLVVPVCCEQ